MNLVFSIFQWLLIVILSFLILLPGIFSAIVNKQLGLKFLRAWTYLCLKISRVDVEVIDENAEGYPSHGILFVTLNQTSLLETFIGPMFLPTDFRVIINFEFALIPLFGWISWLLGAPVLVRQWPSQAKAVMRSVEEDLKTTSNYWMSIEGMRSKDGHLSPYKKGASVLAIQSQVPIVPVCFKGARSLMSYGSWQIKQVEIRFLKAIQTKGLTYENRDDLTLQLRKIAEQQIIPES